MNGASESHALQSGQVYYLGPPINLRASRVFTGANIYYRDTVIRQRVEFGALANTTSAIAGGDFAPAFLQRLRALATFLPDNGLKDDFVARLSSPAGAEFDEILLEAVLVLEHALAFAMHELDTIGYAAIEKQSRHSDLVWRCAVPKLSRRAAEVALAGVVDLLPASLYPRAAGARPDFDAAWKDLREDAVRRRLSPTTSVLKTAARQRGLPCEVPGRQHLRLGHGSAQRQIYSSLTSTTSITAQKVCADKRLTNRRLNELRLPVPRQTKVGSVEAAVAAADKLGYPVVIKPVKGKKGGGVTVGLDSADGIAAAFRRAHQSGTDVLVERVVPGADHRLLVIGGRFVAALTRRPPVIAGDGVSTVEQLLEEINSHPWRDGFRLFEVTRDAELERLLRQAGLGMDDVPASGRTVALRSAANVSTGGVPVDVTDQVHADNREMAERAASGVGLDIAGIDFLTTDIARSYREVGGGIVELNARPGLCMHTWPLEGRSRNVAGEVLKLSFPPGADGRIPIVAVAGDKGTGATARILDMILRGDGRSVGLALRKRAFVNGRSAELSKTQQSQALKVLLRDPQIDTLVSTVSPRQSAKRGLLLDQCTLTVVHDKVREEDTDLFHHGVEILARATSQCFVVGSGNQVALDRLRDLGERQLILVNGRLNDRALQAHLAAGHAAVSTNWKAGKSRIVLLRGAETLAMFDAGVGTLRDGRARRSRLKTATLFAIAAAYGLGLAPVEIAAALEQAPEMVPDAAGA